MMALCVSDCRDKCTRGDLLKKAIPVFEHEVHSPVCNLFGTIQLPAAYIVVYCRVKLHLYSFGFL